MPTPAQDYPRQFPTAPPTTSFFFNPSTTLLTVGHNHPDITPTGVTTIIASGPVAMSKVRHGDGPNSASLPAEPWPSSNGVERSDAAGHTLSMKEIAGITLASVMGTLLVVAFFCLLRRGTFGSGTLFGLKYGDARYAGWGGHECGRKGGESHLVDMQQQRSGAERIVASCAHQDAHLARSLPPDSRHAPPFVVPHAESDPPSYGAALPFPTTAHSFAKRPLSPTAWSTSPSAFDNAYSGLVAPSTTGAPSDTTSVSELSAYTSEPRNARTHSRTNSTFAPSLCHGDFLEITHDRRSTGAWCTPTPLHVPERIQMSTPTLSPSTMSKTTAGEGGRTSSWHSSDSGAPLGTSGGRG